MTVDVDFAEAVRGADPVRRYLAFGRPAAGEPVDHRAWIDYRVCATGPDGRRTIETVIDVVGLVPEPRATLRAGDLYPGPTGSTDSSTGIHAAVGSTTVEPSTWLVEARRITRNQTYVGQG